MGPPSARPHLFRDETGDAAASNLDLQRLRVYPGPVLLSRGDQSAPMVAQALDRIQAVLRKSNASVKHPGPC